MIVITGGGTGGHLAIAKALAQELQKRKIAAIYIGSLYGQDQMWFSRNIDSSTQDPHSTLFQECYFLDTSGVVNKKGYKKLASIYAQLRATWSVRAIFAKHKVQAVISVGGFSAGPASLAAILLRKPLFIHEQNAIQGKLNALLAPFAQAVFNSFLPPYSPYPIHQEVLPLRRIRTECKSIIFIGGSQGAKAINNLALQVAPKLLEKGMRIIHQCGEKDLARVKQAYAQIDSTLLESNNLAEEPQQDHNAKHNPNARLTLFGFDTHLINYLAQADICIARAGASSIWENAALALPTIYIPYPHAAKNHQYHNASYFVQQGLGLMITEQELLALDSHRDSTLGSTMDLRKFFALLSQIESNITEISTNLSKMITDNGAESIITSILTNLDNNRTSKVRK